MIEPKNTEISANDHKFIYRGTSMRSTFRPGHLLYVSPESKKIHPGDVIVYRRGEEFVVHRVNSITPEGLQTRGDDNSRIDEFPIDDNQIVGIVEGVDDGEKTRPVTGGRKGLIIARMRWGFSAFFNRMRPVIGTPYRWLKSSRIMPKIWHPKVIQVKTNSSLGPMIKYLVGGKTVATWLPNLKCFQCRRLYDLVIYPPD